MLPLFPLGEDVAPLKRLRLVWVAVFAVGVGTGCGSSAGQENIYNCNGTCNGEPMTPAVIQAPDQATACTEFKEYCRGTPVCTSCS